MKDDKIDIVYLWVDGSDKKWALQKNKWYKKIYHTENENDKEQYRDNGELKYSLRSVAECAPWVNHIYIITGFNQVPKWLNTKNPKISIIPHELIIPKTALPTFNSVSIEMCIPNIPNLSDKFILMNDDTFFNKKTSFKFFFNNKNQSIVRYNHAKYDPKNIDVYTSTILFSAKTISDLCGTQIYSYYPSHCIDPYNKSSWQKCANIDCINEQIQKQIHNKFRQRDELQRWAFNLYDKVNGYAVFKKARGYKSGKHKVLNFIYNTLHFYAVNHSPVFCFDAIESLQSIKHAPIFCINDSKDSTKQTRINNTKFLKTRFPKKSQFEK